VEAGSIAADGSGSTGSGSTTTQSAHPGARHHVRMAAFKVVLDTTHSTPQELRAALQGGQTIADFAAAHGSSGSDVSKALVEKADARIDRAVANGKLGQDKADALKVKVSGRVDTFVNRTWGQGK